MGVYLGAVFVSTLVQFTLGPRLLQTVEWGEARQILTLVSLRDIRDRSFL